jgi:hypothetical protein
MLTIEHEFKATIITLMDDVAAHREPDVRIALHEDGVSIEQEDEQTGKVARIALSQAQLSDLIASANLPEGAYVKAP